MSNNDDTVPVSKFIAESERNIEIASEIYLQYENAREEIVKEFFARLRTGFQQKLPGWSGRYSDQFFTYEWGAFDFYKSNWARRYTIRLEAYAWGSDFIYGVWRNEELLLNGPHNPQLLDDIREKLPGAIARECYEAEIRMSLPAKDWRVPKVLWRLRSNEEFREEIEALLIEVAEIAAPHIDRMEEQNPRPRGR